MSGHAVPVGEPSLAARLRSALQGEVRFDRFSRGRYSTDASIYQIEPIGVVIPKTPADVYATLEIAAEAGVPVLPRGAGTSQCGQAVGRALVIDTSRHLNELVYLDCEARRVKVQPGMVLDELNGALAPHGLFFPVDISTANRATLGGMAGNNSCGARSIRYGNMVHNVRAINAVLADGTKAQFGEIPGDLRYLRDLAGGGRYLELVQRMRDLGQREADEIARRFPDLLRRVGGYNLDSISASGHNMAHLLVGSEGTLAFFTELELDLQPIPAHRVLGVCHFPSFYQAMTTTQAIVELGPTAVELVDRTLLELAREIDQYSASVARFVRGQPESVLLVEFAGEDRADALQRLARLEQLMGDHGFPDSVVRATDDALQREIWEVRKAGLNIVMSMKGEGKPVSFIEDCAVRLEDLAEYTRRLEEIFARHGTSGTWYAHASVGTLHVRPILNLKKQTEVAKMRAIAEECFAMVREYKGSHSGEHGDGLVRSEFHQAMFGERIVGAFEEVKRSFDPEALFNPGKIVHPPKMDDRSLFRYAPGYRALPIESPLDWSAWGGFSAAVEMCNNNGACRKSTGVMCPSYRVTRDEAHVTRGRANALRLALTGQLGPEAFTSSALHRSLDLCVGCKGCRRECPTGVDMSRMKSEFLHHYHRKHGLPLRERLFAYLPRYAHWLARLPALANLRNSSPLLARLGERWLGVSARRELPRWRSDYFGWVPSERAANTPRSDVPGSDVPGSEVPGSESQVVLLVDTFNRWFEPENARAASALLETAGYRPTLLDRDPAKHRPLCCGRTFLSAGLLDEARHEATRMVETLYPYARRGVPIVGLEPACLLTLRDELPTLLSGREARTIADQVSLLEEFIAAENHAGRLKLEFRAAAPSRVLVHGHCHQKAFGTMGALQQVLEAIPGVRSEMIQSSCCGMAGSFGYESEHYDLSLKMGELDVLPAARAAASDTLIVANGTSCRQQILSGAGREAWHVARLLQASLAESPNDLESDEIGDA